MLYVPFYHLKEVVKTMACSGKLDVHSQRGFSLTEILAGMMILPIVSLAVMRSGVMSNEAFSKSRLLSVARQLASETLEEYSNEDPQSLTDGTVVTDIVNRSNIAFDREVAVVINAEHRSRDVSVTVSTTTKPKISVTFNNSYVLWGKR